MLACPKGKERVLQLMNRKVEERSHHYEIREEHNVNNCPKVRGLLNLGFDDTRISKKRKRMENPSTTSKASSSRNKRYKVEGEEKTEKAVLVVIRVNKVSCFPLWNDDQLTKIKEKEGLPISVYDCDTRTEHNLVYKQWKKTNVLVNNWVKGFVEMKELKVGDEIGLYWDTNSSRFNFSVLNRAVRI
ncbi:hypothetical protein DITRI_Ditri16bG0002200 [Diplodiscus trichospermus]